MKTLDQLIAWCNYNGKNPAYINPAIEGLCGIIDGKNRRIEALERKLKKVDDE